MITALPLETAGRVGIFVTSWTLIRPLSMVHNGSIKPLLVTNSDVNALKAVFLVDPMSSLHRPYIDPTSHQELIQKSSRSHPEVIQKSSRTHP